MTIGFDAIGQAALGEQSSDGIDTIIYAPAIGATAAVAPPSVFSGKSIFASGQAATASATAPSIRVGAAVFSAGLSATVALTAGQVSISARVVAPGAAAAATLAAPTIMAGAFVQVPAKTATATIVAPVVSAGKSVFAPGAAATATLAAPGISISAAIRPSGIAATATLAAPQIFGGNYIEATNTVTMVTPYGEIGSSSIGQFSIGEGELSTRIVRIGLLARCNIEPPFITAGKSIFPGGKNAIAALGRPEIDGRARKLRILAIAS